MKFGRLSEHVRRSLSGRYGADQFGLFLALFSAFSLLLSVFCRRRLGRFFFFASMVSLVFCLIRFFSRDSRRRSAENKVYMDARWQVQDWSRLQKTRYQQRKDYVFFSCPGCRQTMRVPRGKGKIRITCRHCGYMFEKKT